MQVLSPLTHLHADTGNSLSNVPYKKDVDQICRGLERWMSILLGRQFKNDGQTLPIGAQQDGVSCGICVLNAFEHALFDVPLFTHSNRNSLRAQYFTEIAKLLLDHVSAIDDLVQTHRTNPYHRRRHQCIITRLMNLWGSTPPVNCGASSKTFLPSLSPRYRVMVIAGAS